MENMSNTTAIILITAFMGIILVSVIYAILESVEINRKERERKQELKKNKK